MNNLSNQLRQQILGYVTGSLGLIAGLAWNEAIKDLINYLFPLSHSSLLAKCIYATSITIIVVILSVYVFSRLQPSADTTQK